MDLAIRWIGALVVAIVLIGIPVVTTMSFICGWHPFIQWIGIIITVLETFGLWNAIVERSEL